MDVQRIFDFPDPVNETSARLIAAGVVVMGVSFLLFREGWLLIPLVYGFAARVLAGPKASPLGQLSMRIAAPFIARRFGVRPRRVPGPPKRFAQLIGLGFTVGAAVAWSLGVTWLASTLIVGLVAAASLEAFASICLGCIAYSAMWGCDDCDDISDRLQQAVARSRQPVDAVEVAAPTT